MRTPSTQPTDDLADLQRLPDGEPPEVDPICGTTGVGPHPPSDEAEDDCEPDLQAR